MPKGEDEGGGGGADSGADGSMRKDFRVLAFWLGSVTTDANGMASIDVKLPESLTTYRIMAVAGDKASRFGRSRERNPHQQTGHAEARVSALHGGGRHVAFRIGRHQSVAGSGHRHRHDEEPGSVDPRSQGATAGRSFRSPGTGRSRSGSTRSQKPSGRRVCR